MYDGSKLPFERNVETTRALVRAAHAVGVPVEAGLGHVRRGDEYADLDVRRQGYTDPDDAVRFVEQTGIDILAVAMGTAHGLYHSQSQLNMDLVDEIRARVEVPLVLHRGSGVTEDQCRDAIARGISKINVATGLYVTAGRRLVEAAQAEDASYHSLTQTAIESFEERCGYCLDLFGASRKGFPGP
jgi:fructose-bisphosphate aldolase class II